MHEKGKNLATKEDIGQITTAVEDVRKIYARDLELMRTQLNVIQSQVLLYSNTQFDRISSLWVKLQEIKFYADALWSQVDTKNLVKLSGALEATTLQLAQASIFIDPPDFQQLRSVLERFQEFKLGKTSLLELRSHSDVDIALKAVGDSALAIRDLVDQNSTIKVEYERLLMHLEQRFSQNLARTLPMGSEDVTP